MSIHIIVPVLCPAGLQNMSTLHFASALLPSGWADDVQVVVTDGTITKVTAGVAPGADDERHQLAIPGIASLHSHAFQRGMAGLAETRGNTADTFWTWRETMYRFALEITPEDTEAVATLLYVEMLEQGYTRVGEFHYLHHDHDGAPYANPAEMAMRIARAAETTGIGLTLLPSFYAHGSFGGVAPHAGQRRFICSVDQFAKLLDATRTAVRDPARCQCRRRAAQPAGRDAGRIGGDRRRWPEARRCISTPPNRSEKSKSASPGPASGRSSGCSNMRRSISAAVSSTRPT